ncbi:MAG TPA: amidase [Deltaproteobacteria bacterium]|nr:amidase [SAR324 cluster bacterium]HBL55390.1 amidase [Deltaproteobacteria bacterium]HHZ78598.1 amidase [Candidatus Lambdaproteobacteria bacterium]HIB93098.1 amidase [Candidatus Lambdaproteobacteria bacterium]HIN46875.1 amidase [Deltaproteobacteria bacterium]
MKNNLWQLSACEMAQGIREKKFSSEEVMYSVTERMALHNPRLNAVVDDYSDEAIAEAREADRILAAGEVVGELHGVPVTIKSNVDVEGKPTPNGLPAFADLIAPADSPVVSNLKKAGAIIIGRTNTPELSIRFTTDNPLHGRTLNPWHEDASPGGSSGGASSAAAAGFGPIHHGNDIGGSLRCPAFNCGLATVKPTFGRVPAWLPSAPAERGMLAQLMSVQGAICREVRDVRLATRLMAQADPRDPFWMPVPFEGWPEESGAIRVGVTSECYGHSIHPEITASIDRAAGYLSDAGFAVEQVTTPSVDDAANCWLRYLGNELKSFLMPVAREHGSKTVQKILEWYFEIGEVDDAEDYRIGIKERTAMTREWDVFLDKYPLVLSPYFLQQTPEWNCDTKSLEEMRTLFQSGIYSLGTNWLSLPAGVVPIGLVEELPAGVQIIGRRFREDLILDAMESIEARVGVLTQKLWERDEMKSLSFLDCVD